MRPAEPGLDVQFLSNLVGASPAFGGAIALIRRFACSKAPLLIIGETGTGKELAAHATHYLSDRSGAAFIPVNCGALPEGLIESELSIDPAGESIADEGCIDRTVERVVFGRVATDQRSH